MAVGGPPEVIESENVLRRGAVTNVEQIKTKWSIFIAVASLVIGSATLVAAVATGRTDLIAWATGLISSIAGSALTYGFNSKSQS